MKLNVKACAFAFSVFWGVAIFLLTWWLILLDGATSEVTALGRFYIGYNVSAGGSVIGLLWGLVDGFICGAIIAWLYNFFCDKFARGE